MPKCKSSTHPCPAGTNCPEFKTFVKTTIVSSTTFSVKHSEFPNSILESLTASFLAYRTFGARSSKKLDPLHGMIASSCIRAGAESVQGKGYGENKEFKVQGAFGSKDCDITIFDKESKPISVIAVKFPITNYKQNSNNYFESSMGETANLQLAGVSVNQAIFLPYQMPYLNKAGEIIKMEKITDSDISKYRKLFESNQIVSPANLHIQLIDLWGNDLVIGVGNKPIIKTNHSISTIKDYTSFSNENQNFLNKVSNYENFIKNSVTPKPFILK